MGKGPGEGRLGPMGADVAGGCGYKAEDKN